MYLIESIITINAFDWVALHADVEVNAEWIAIEAYCAGSSEFIPGNVVKHSVHI